MKIVKIIFLIYAAMSVFGTIGYLSKKKKIELHKRADTWLQWTPFVINITHAGLIGLAYFRIGTLNVPTLLAQILCWLGFLIFTFGLIFGFYSSKTLGDNTIADIGIKKNHTLTTSGTFAYCRHPIYLSMITIWLGSALVFVNYNLFFGFITVSIIQTLRARKEEELLSQDFGSQFEEYCKNVPLLIPSFLGCSEANEEIEKAFKI